RRWSLKRGNPKRVDDGWRLPVGCATGGIQRVESPRHERRACDGHISGLRLLRLGETVDAPIEYLVVTHHVETLEFWLGQQVDLKLDFGRQDIDEFGVSRGIHYRQRVSVDWSDGCLTVVMPQQH